ncbi:MAG: hypothetical protein PHE24_01650 [Patescibacteria group bacterium]|nr:hypothetical protein [Patescibacteria group bacterium]
MNNSIEFPEQTKSLSYLDREEDWEQKIKETIALYDWGIVDLLHEDESKKIEKKLAFADIPAAEQAAYAETAGRLALGLMNFGGMRASLTEEKSRFEMIMLRGKISGHNPDLEPFLHMLCLHLAREADTNTTGDSSRVFSEVITDAAVNAARAGKPELHDSLINPFHLETGMEILKFNEKTGEAEKMTIETLIENGDGIIFFGKGENDYEDIITFNRKLSLGEYVKKDSENYFGGAGYLKEKFNLDKLVPGTVIKIDASHPLSKEQITEEVTVVKSNQAELEEQYGPAWLAFLDHAPRNKKLLTVSMRSATGEIFEDVNFMTLKIVE